MFSLDARFATSNTNLAACLGALKVPIKSEDPCSKVEDGETGKRIVTFFFEERGETHESRKIKWAWDNRAEFEKLNPGHALTDMRRGLEKLEFVTKVWWGNITPAARAGTPDTETDDATLAALYMTAGHELHSFAKPLYRFQIPEDERERIIEESECYRHGDSPIANARRAIECRALLLDLVKRAPKLLHYAQGEGHDGYIPAGSTKEQLEKFFAVLYD